jgi:hypothetical protein
MKYMVMLGCVPADLEQHDIFLELVLPWKKWSKMKDFGPSKGRIHIDAWREVAAVDNFQSKL